MAVEPQRHAVADTLSAAGENRSAVRPVMEGMDDAARREQLTQHWEYAASDQDIAHEIYHEDAILEFPQSGERFVGVENFREWRRQYPAHVEFKIRDIRGGGAFWVGETSLSYDGGPWHLGVAILEFRGEKVAHETIYVTEPWEAPEWRKPWRDDE